PEGSWPAQEPRRAPTAMIASLNVLASSAGLDVLRRGGNAVDAAVAAGAVLTVTEPWSGQLGGDGFLLVRSGETGQVTAVNGSGAAPAAARLDAFAARGAIPETGWWASTVPGLVDAWRVALERFGSRSLAELLEPAIAYAEDGFPLTARQSRSIEAMAAGFTPEPAAVRPPWHRAPARTDDAGALRPAPPGPSQPGNDPPAGGGVQAGPGRPPGSPGRPPFRAGPDRVPALRHPSPAAGAAAGPPASGRAGARAGGAPRYHLPLRRRWGADHRFLHQQPVQ